MVAPDLRREEVILILSFKEMPFAGSGMRAEPPPDIRLITRSFLSAFFAIFKISFAPFTPFAFGSG